MRPLLLGLAALALVAGCSSSSEGSSSDDTVAPDTGVTVVEDGDTGTTLGDTDDTSPIQLRPVLQACFVVTPTSGETLPSAGQLGDGEAGYVPLSNTDQWCLVGPSQGDGSVFGPDAEAVELAGNGWSVQASLRPGIEGEDIWNALAAQCFQKVETCPTGQLSIVLDGAAISVASVQVPEFQGTVQISGNFTEAEARELADLINTGAA